MTLSITNKNKEIFKQIYNNNTVVIEYIISYNNGFLYCKIKTTIDTMPLTFNDLLNLSKKLKNIYELNNNENIKLLITINNCVSKHKEIFKIEYLEEIVKN
jgi:hypothetical protein